MGDSSKPVAKQLINVDIQGRLILEKNTLKEILKDEIKDLPVVVISIVGTYRQGKSFLLNFFLRFLILTCKEKRSVGDWLDPRYGTLSGFVWKRSSRRETIGIMMWPEIFISKDKSGDEVAIVLLDTQGTYDNQTSMKDFATITALSTLISSVQIYNMMHTIRQNELLSLKDILDYGELIKKEHSGPLFQNFIFLIRDWFHHREYAYGKEGGQRYLTRELRFNTNKPDDLINLKQFFKSFSAFLLPVPGDQVLNKATNNLAEMNDDFKTHVKDFVEEILKPENLVVKEINGTRVKVSDLFILIEKYHEQFQSGKMPSVKSTFQASVEVQHQWIVEDCLKIYEDLMSFDKDPKGQAEEESSFRDKHETMKQSTLEEFDNKKKLGDEPTQRKYREKLIERIETDFDVYHSLNGIKLQREEGERQKEELLKKNKENDKVLNDLKEKLQKVKVKSEQDEMENKERKDKALKQLERENRKSEKEEVTNAFGFKLHTPTVHLELGYSSRRTQSKYD